MADDNTDVFCICIEFLKSSPSPCVRRILLVCIKPSKVMRSSMMRKYWDPEELQEWIVTATNSCWMSHTRSL